MRGFLSTTKFKTRSNNSLKEMHLKSIKCEKQLLTFEILILMEILSLF